MSRRLARRLHASVTSPGRCGGFDTTQRALTAWPIEWVVDANFIVFLENQDTVALREVIAISAGPAP